MACPLRWAVDVAAWQPDAGEWAAALALLPADEQRRVLRFAREDDRRRALASQLLQRAAVRRVLGGAWGGAELRRTSGGKPFCAAATAAARGAAPNFNFNVSHEGDYVVLAAEGHCVCGVDVAAPQQLRRPGARRALAECLALFRDQLCDSEWDAVQALAGDEGAMEAAFQSIWSCKEAYVKARGDGLAFQPLSRIQVLLPPGVPGGGAAVGGPAACARPVVSAQLAVDGALQTRWRVFLQQLPRRHWVAVARGPPEAVVDYDGAFKATFLEPRIPDERLQVLLDAPSPAFDLIPLEDLLPDDSV